MEPLYDKMRRLNEIYKDEKVERRNRQSEKSKSQLIHIIEKKFQTTFIGNISAVEDVFGHLWGKNKAHAERTPQEKEFYLLWQQLRTRILDNGNHQARAVINELQQYLVDWRGYNMNLRSKDNVSQT
jgi:hypothetical protein